MWAQNSLAEAALGQQQQDSESDSSQALRLMTHVFLLLLIQWRLSSLLPKVKEREKGGRKGGREYVHPLFSFLRLLPPHEENNKDASSYPRDSGAFSNSEPHRTNTARGWKDRKWSYRVE